MARRDNTPHRDCKSLLCMFVSVAKQTFVHFLFLTLSLAAQILTAQFRQMEQELAEAVKLSAELRQQSAEQASRADEALRTGQEALERERAEVARQERELASLREAEHVSLEAVEKVKMEVARSERELALTKEAELAAIQACRDAAERESSEISRLERELASSREAEYVAVHDNQSILEREKSEIEELERERASRREEQEEAQKKDEILSEILRRLQSLDLEDRQPSEENPTDLSLFLDTVTSIGAQLTRLRDEHSDSEGRCAELTQSMEALQGEIPSSNSVFISNAIFFFFSWSLL